MARASNRPAPARVRWDRLGRAAMLFVLVVLAYLYIGPARALVGALGASSARHADVGRLERQHEQLTAQRNALESPGTLEQAARNLGLVLPGERPYVVSGLPPN